MDGGAEAGIGFVIAHGARWKWRQNTRTIAAILVSIGTLSGSAYLAIDSETLVGLMRALTAARSGTDAAVHADGPAIGEVGDVSGGIYQHVSRNKYVYNNRFRVEVVRRTGDAPVPSPSCATAAG